MENFLAYLVVGLGVMVAASLAYAKYLEFRGSDFGHKMTMIIQLVQAAEQKLGKEPGEARLGWVMEKLQLWFPDTDVDELRVLVEAAVWRVKQAQAISGDLTDFDDQGGMYWLGTGRHN